MIKHVTMILSLGVYLIFFVSSCVEYLLECGNGLGTDYRGTNSRTKTGKMCQRWDATFPHRPKYVFTCYPILLHIISFCVFTYITCQCVCLKFHPKDPPSSRPGLQLLQKSWCWQRWTLVLHHRHQHPMGAL